MNPLEVVNLTSVMALTSGRPEIVIGLIDGPVAMDHPDLTKANLREVSGRESKCHQKYERGLSPWDLHRRHSLRREAFSPPRALPRLHRRGAAHLRRVGRRPGPDAQRHAGGTGGRDRPMIAAGARLLNLSVALSHPSGRGERRLEEALDYAAEGGDSRGRGRESGYSRQFGHHPPSLGHTGILMIPKGGRKVFPTWKIYRHQGFGAPGHNITSLNVAGQPLSLSGTSVAVPFVTGALALLWSEFPAASAAELQLAIRQAKGPRRPAAVPPLMDAWAAYEALRLS